MDVVTFQAVLSCNKSAVKFDKHMKHRRPLPLYKVEKRSEERKLFNVTLECNLENNQSIYIYAVENEFARGVMFTNHNFHYSAHGSQSLHIVN